MAEGAKGYDEAHKIGSYQEWQRNPKLAQQLTQLNPSSSMEEVTQKWFSSSGVGWAAHYLAACLSE